MTPPAPSFPHPLLVADVGGTNARFAVAAEPGAAPRPIARCRTLDCPTAEDAIETALAAMEGERPRSLVVCVAGPVLGRAAQLTNAAWLFDGVALAERFGFDQGLVLNDFEAAALSLAVAGPDDVAAVVAAPEEPRDGAPVLPEPDEPPVRGPRLILGPGTGLGVAALIEVEGRVMPLPGEAGHISFGPADAEEERFWPHVARVEGRVTPETLLSGPGLLRLHRALAAADGLEAPEGDPAAIAARARDEGCPRCGATAARFLDLLARFAGDMAIAFGATGGVFLRGGVMTSLAPLVDPARFEGIFAAKEPVEALARRIPVHRLTGDEIVLRGMAAIGAEPGRFILNYAGRLWRP